MTISYTTRIAPSPTGDMHLGTARTAYFNWLIAKATKGHFILRIDDTDPERSKDEYIDVILRTMEWLGLDYDKIEYQSKRKDIYISKANELLNMGFAKKEDNGAISFIPKELPSSWKDEIVGAINISKEDIDIINKMILVRSDSNPTYHFASTVDDYMMGINYIIRGVDHISNTPRHIALLSIFKDTMPKFAHIGLIYKDKKKMSKRDGAASMLEYRNAGYKPEAMLNYMLRLGWSPSDPNFDKKKPLISKHEAIDLFLTAGKMRSSAANFDKAKLDWYNSKY